MGTHHCRAAVLHCIDFRFQEAVDKFIADQGLNGDTDRIGIAGGTKNLGEVFEELSVSEDLHQVKNMYLINHQDCGAYGPEVAKNPEEELKTHSHDLLLAKKLILEKYPTVQVHTLFVDLDKQVKEIT